MNNKFELELSNHYGSVQFYEKEGKYYMELDDYSSADVLEIPLYLYEALLKFYGEFNESK